MLEQESNGIKRRNLKRAESKSVDSFTSATAARLAEDFAAGLMAFGEEEARDSFKAARICSQFLLLTRILGMKAKNGEGEEEEAVMEAPVPAAGSARGGAGIASIVD